MAKEEPSLSHMIAFAVACGIPKEYAQANPFDAFVRAKAGLGVPARNDCGYPSRFEYEDNARLFGWGTEGEGLCDYPQACPAYRGGKCPVR